MRIVEKTDISCDANAVLRRTNCIGKDAMQSGGGTRGKDRGDRMRNQEAIALLRNLEDSLDSYCELNEEGKTVFRMAIEALSCSEFPNSSDTIYRQAAIDEIKALYEWHEIVTEDRAIDHFKRLPSAQPEQKKGRWIPVTNGRGGFECDECHNYAPSFQDGVEWLSDYCPNCGADMRGDK